jgi:polysaccharide deacetylase 2 family uncharacterized protein YibQ
VANEKNSNRQPRRSEGKRPWFWLILVIVAICGLFALLERVKNSVTPPPARQQAQGERHAMPERVSGEYEQKAYTTAHEAAPPRQGKGKRAVGPGSLAIIVDDMGSSMQEANALLAIQLPLTFSIIPGLAKARGVAEAVHAKGGEIMLHMPMEPQGYPEQKLEKNGLLVSMASSDITARVGQYLQDIPQAVGANNHMGSRFTEQEEKMRPVLALLKERGLFFIDSKTSPRSVGYRLAREMGLDSGARSVFLDNVQDVAAIKTQLLTAANLARRRGNVIAICHPHAATIKALREGMPQLAQEGITFVTASQLVR